MFDRVQEALSGLVGLYGQVETIKLQSQLAKAAVSNAYAAEPNQMKNAQAKAESLANKPRQENNTALIIGAAVVGVVGIYLLVK